MTCWARGVKSFMLAFPMPGASRLTLLKVDPGISTSTFNIKTRRNRILLLIINRSLHGEFSPQSSEVNYLPEGTPVVSASLTNNVVSQMCWLWRFGALATQSCGWQKSSEGCHVLLGEKTTDHKDVDSRLPLTENVVSSVDPRISILRGSLK